MHGQVIGTCNVRGLIAKDCTSDSEEDNLNLQTKVGATVAVIPNDGDSPWFAKIIADPNADKVDVMWLERRGKSNIFQSTKTKNGHHHDIIDSSAIFMYHVLIHKKDDIYELDVDIEREVNEEFKLQLARH